ncbi:LytR C-terminal domain-containing protein [Micromonospora sediminicola]|uniref:LytR C-terminal domain-containing protein n=1 Tax=Micromonospora sediminicola TaxID=946078 RepID=UPI0033FBEDE6
MPSASNAPQVGAVPATPGCPAGFVGARIWAPGREDTKISIVNASGHANRGAVVASELRTFRFEVLAVTQAPEVHDGVAVLRYGPQTVGAAWNLQAFFPDGVTLQFELRRVDDVVEVAIGKRFSQLPDITEVNQATAKLPLPTAPPGTCPIPPI